MKNSHQPIIVVALCAVATGYCVAEARHLRKENARIARKSQAIQDYWNNMRKAENEGKLTQDVLSEYFWKLVNA